MNISESVQKALANYHDNKSDFVALPEGILTPAFINAVGTGGTCKFDFSNATSGTNTAKTAKNLGKKIGFVIVSVTCGQVSTQARISFSQADQIINSGNDTWNCTVFSQDSDDGKVTYNNLMPNSAVGATAPATKVVAPAN